MNQYRKIFCLTAVFIALAAWTTPLSAQSSIVAAPSALAFYHQTGTPDPAAQLVQVTAPAGQTVNVSFATTSGLWLFATPSSGSGTFTVQVFALRIPNTGTFNGTVTLSSTATTPVTIPVTYTVSNNPLLTVLPVALAFSYSLNAAVPTPQSVAVGTTGAAQVGFSASADMPWLSVRPLSDTTPASLSVSVNVANLAVGTYIGNVTVLASGVDNPVVRVQVALRISDEKRLVVSPSSLQFVHQAGSSATPVPKTLTVTSTGALLPYTVTTQTTTNPSWLTVTPVSGTTPGILSVSVTPGTLGTGDWQGTIRIESTDATNSPQIVNVTLRVTTDPVFSAEPAALSFNYQTGGATPSPRVFVLSNTGASLSVNVTTSGGSWLTAAPSSTQSPVAVLVSVNPLGVQPGTYSGAVVVTQSGNQANSISVPVTLTVSATPLLSADRDELVFYAQTGGAAPVAKSFTVSSTGAAFNYTAAASVGANWLSVTQSGPATGTSVSATVNPGSLPAGVYSAFITLTPAIQATPVVNLPVTLHVGATAQLSVDQAPLLFTYNIGSGQRPANQLIAVRSTGVAFNFAAAGSTSTGGGWLAINPASGSTGENITVGVDIGLGAGIYTGLVTVASPGIPNSPQYVPVLLHVTSTAALVVTPSTALTFTQTAGASPPAAQTVRVSSTGSPLNVTVAVSVLGGGNWLSADRTSGLTPFDIAVSVNGSALPTGSYAGSVTITSAGATNSPQIIPVTMNVVRATVPLTAAPASLTFNAQLPGTTPGTQGIQVTAPSSISIRASATTNWLTVTPQTGTTPATLVVGVVLTGLAAGNYRGEVVIESADASNSPLRVPVTLNLTAVPIGQISAFTNSASGLPSAGVPGLIATLWGTNLGPTDGVTARPQGGRFPTTVAEVRVLFDGLAAPLWYVSAAQINLIVPYAVSGRFSTRVEVEYRGVKSNVLELRVNETGPGIYSANNTGRGQGAILNQNNTVNVPANPADKDSIIQIYATGEGQTNPPGEDGVVITTNLKKPLRDVRVRIGGVEAVVEYAGSAPGYVSGALQVNARIPDSVASGPDVPLELTIGGAPSQPGITVAVR